MRQCSFFLSLLVAALSAFPNPGLSQEISNKREFPTAPPPLQAQDVGGAFWRTDGNFEAVLRLRNLLADTPLLVTPVLWLADGTEYDLPVTMISGRGLSIININQALRDAPSNIQAHLSQLGSAGMRYDWNWQDAVVGEVTSTDEIASLVYNTHMGAALQSSGSRKLAKRQSFADEGMWWKRDSGVIPYLYLVNVNTSPTTAHISVSGAVTDPTTTQDVTLAAYETKMMSLQTLISALAHPVMQGGLSITYSGAGRPLNVEGALENANTGYSLTFPILRESTRSARNEVMHGSIDYAAVGIQLGPPKPSMNFPEGTEFIPYATLRNLSGKAITVSSTVNVPDGSNSSLPALTLLPGETRQMDLSSLHRASSSSSTEVNLLFSYQGAAGDVVIATGSTAKDGSYVFAIDPQVKNVVRGDIQSIWQVDGPIDTMISFWNTGSAAEDDAFELNFGSGTYTVPIHLEANASMSLDLGELLNKGVPDPNGVLIPRNVTQGQARLRPLAGVRAQMDTRMHLSIFNSQTATCKVPCNECDGVIYVISAPSDGVTRTGTTIQYVSAAKFHDGTYGNVTFGSTWSSANTGLATVANGSSAGIVNGVSFGQTSIKAQYSDTGYSSLGPGDLCNYPAPPCPVYVGNPTQPVTVGDQTPILTGIDPSDWTSGHAQSVTFTGEYFGTNAPTLSFSPGTGISYTLTSYNDTQIVANVNVASGTPNENVQVSVTNNGYGGAGFQSGGSGASPTSAPVYATVHSPLNSPEITIIAWVNGNASDVWPLPTGANPALSAHLTGNSQSCNFELFEWTILKIAADISTAADKTYANAWLIHNSGNPAPPSTINASQQFSAGNYRLFNDFGHGGGVYRVGATPNPCGSSVPGVLAWLDVGQASPYMGSSGTTSAGHTYQLAEGRVGIAGQNGNQVINGKTVPWIWSVISFDASGNPLLPADHAMFPTYSVYQNGGLVATYPQSTVQSFIANDQTYQRTPSQIQ